MNRTILILLHVLTIAAAYPPGVGKIKSDVSASEALQPAGAQVDNVVFEGVLEPLSYVNLSFQNSGQIVEILVEEGDTVQAGDPVVRLESRAAELALQQAQDQLLTSEAGLNAAQAQLLMAQAKVSTAEGQVTVAQALLALTSSGPRPEEIAAAEAGVAAAQAVISQAVGNRDIALDISSGATIHAAEADLAVAVANRQALEIRYNNILTNCVTQPDGSQVCPEYGPVEESTRAQLAAARAAESAAQAALDQLISGPSSAQQAAAGGLVTIAIANRDVAQAEMDLLLAEATPEEIAQVQVAVSRAEVSLAVAMANVPVALASVSLAEAQVVAAGVAVAGAQLALDRLTLDAPFDGTVAEVNANPGELVSVGSPLVTLADYSGWQVRTTSLTQLDVARIAPGNEAEIKLDAFLGATLTGTVAKVALVPALEGGAVGYEAIIGLESTPTLPLRWGMTALINVQVE